MPQPLGKATWAVLLGGLLASGLLAAEQVFADGNNVQFAAPQWAASGPLLAGRVYYPRGMTAARRMPTLAPVPEDVQATPFKEETALPPPPEGRAEAAETPQPGGPPDPAYESSVGDSCLPPCDPCCGPGGCCCLGSGKPCELFDCPGLKCCGIKVGGWLQHGVTSNTDDPIDRFNGPVATNDRDDEYLMNQLWLFIDKPAKTDGCGCAIGGHVDMLYGSDYRFGINHGLENRINSLDQFYGMVIPQAYAEVAINNLSVKLGHFAAILDYEVIPGPFNPFYSHSYSYGYTVPQLVTGVLADYKLTDRLSVAAGFHRGWMMFEDINDDLDFMGGVTWTSYDKRTSVTYALSTGAQDPAGEQERFVYSFVLKEQLSRKLQYILVHNLGYENNAVTWLRGPAQDAEWYGLNQYFLYQINPCWSACARLEWLRDDDGARIFGVPNVIPPVRTWPRGPGFAGDFFEVSLGLNWRPHPNVVFRPEVRWDWYDGTRDVRNELPFDDGTSDDQTLFAVDMIVTY